MWFADVIMPRCKLCKEEMPTKDQHENCIQHRKCTRRRPCSLDRHETDSYWDSVERTLSAAKMKSPLHNTRKQVFHKQDRKEEKSSDKRKSSSSKPTIQMSAQGSFGRQSRSHSERRSVSKDKVETNRVSSTGMIQSVDGGKENLTTLGHQIKNSQEKQVVTAGFQSLATTEGRADTQSIGTSADGSVIVLHDAISHQVSPLSRPPFQARA